MSNSEAKKELAEHMKLKVSERRGTKKRDKNSSPVVG